MSKTLVTLRESRPELEKRLYVTGGKGEPLLVGVLKTPEETKLRFAKSSNELTAEEGFVMELVFTKKNSEELSAFQELVQGLSQEERPLAKAKRLMEKPDDKPKARKA